MRAGGATSAGSSRFVRLDPFALPVSFAAHDAAADERVRFVELHRQRVVVRRAVGGIRMALNLPVNAYLGVAIRMLPPQGNDAGRNRRHAGAPRSRLVAAAAVAPDGDEVIAEWQSWARVLALPLLVTDGDGSCVTRSRGSARLRIAAPTLRRRRRNAIKSAPAVHSAAAPSRPHRHDADRAS